MRQRWLILTSSTGSGHDVRSYALKDWAEFCLGSEVEVQVWHALEESSHIGRFGVWIYNRIQRHWPALHFIFWHITEVWGWIQKMGTPFGGKDVAERFKAFRPHVVISMHDSLNAPYFAQARTALGKDSVRCATYCGEWSPGFGFSRHWVDPTVDCLIARTASVAQLAVKWGVPAERTLTFRDLLRRSDFDSRMLWEERRRYRAEVLSLDPDAFTLLLASGMKGADHHERMLEAVAELAGRVQVIVLCGKNEATLTRTQKWAQQHPEVRLSIHSYTEKVGPLFQASDVVLTRGGSNTLAECVHFSVPAIFHAERGPMPQEFCTSRFLLSEGIGQCIRSPKELKTVLQTLLDEPEIYKALIKKMGALRGAEHPSKLVEHLHQLGQEVVC